MTGDQAASLPDVRKETFREVRTSSAFADAADDSLGPISPTLPGSTTSLPREEVHATNRDTDSEDGASPETINIPAAKSEQVKTDLRNRNSGARKLSGDGMDTDE